MLIASFLFAFMGLFAKVLSATLPSLEIVFFRNIFGVVSIGYLLYKTPSIQIGGRPWLLFFRGFMGFAALLFFFYNLAHIPLAEAMTFSRMSPIFTAIFSYLLLKEELSARAWFGVFIGFIGVLFITKFDGGTLDKTDWLGILSGAVAGIAYTSIRELRNYYDTKTIAFSFATVGTVGPALLMGIGEFYAPPSLDFMLAKFVMPQVKDIGTILLLGVISTYAQIYMTKAYSGAKAGIISTIGYSNILFSVILGFFIGDAFPDAIIWTGIALIVTSGILAAKEK